MIGESGNVGTAEAVQPLLLGCSLCNWAKAIWSQAMIRTIRVLLIGMLLVLGMSPARAAEQVDLLLVLAADVSRSVDQKKFQLQREGYAAAITDARVLKAISSGMH